MKKYILVIIWNFLWNKLEENYRTKVLSHKAGCKRNKSFKIQTKSVKIKSMSMQEFLICFGSMRLMRLTANNSSRDKCLPWQDLLLSFVSLN